jgi:hypothetical protein
MILPGNQIYHKLIKDLSLKTNVGKYHEKVQIPNPAISKNKKSLGDRANNPA